LPQPIDGRRPPSAQAAPRDPMAWPRHRRPARIPFLIPLALALALVALVGTTRCRARVHFARR
jgi:hypothetical protein